MFSWRIKANIDSFKLKEALYLELWVYLYENGITLFSISAHLCIVSVNILFLIMLAPGC